MLKKLKPHHFHFTVGILLFLISFLEFFADMAYDIAIGDTYYVIGLSSILYPLSLMSIFSGVWYYFFRNRIFNKWINLSHNIFVFLRVLAFFTSVSYVFSPDYSNRVHDEFDQMVNFYLIIIFLLGIGLGTLFLILNLAFSKKGKT